MAETRVKIKLFGNFVILVDGNVVLPQLRQAKKTTLLLQYLILKRGQPVSHEELLGMLWSDKESSNPATALRTLLHRYRALVDSSNLPELEHSVLTTRGSYQWNPGLDCEIDAFEFERLCAEAAKDALPIETRMALYEEALLLYMGPLLPGSAAESWVVPRSVFYHDMYLESVFTYIELLKAQENYDKIIQICRKAMDVDMYDERLHLELMMALVKTGRKREALSQYDFTSDYTSKREGGPSEDIRNAYRMIVQADSEMEADIEKVQSMLENEPEEQGALVCQYEVFKEIYQLQRRVTERNNSTIFLAMLSVRDGNDQQPMDSLVLDSITKQLCNVLQHYLRRGDTISRYSATQYVVLLPAVTYESGKLVMERVKKEFYATYVKSSVVLTIKLRPLAKRVFEPDETPKKRSGAVTLIGQEE